MFPEKIRKPERIITAPMIRTTQPQVLTSFVSGSSVSPRAFSTWFELVTARNPSITLKTPTMMIMIPAKVFQPAPELS